MIGDELAGACSNPFSLGRALEGQREGCMEEEDQEIQTPTLMILCGGLSGTAAE